MNDFEPQLIEIPENSTKNKFPIVAQLGVLSVIMLLIFGSLLLKPEQNQPNEVPNHQNISTDSKKYPITPQKIDEVSIKAGAAYVWDVRGNRALYSKNETEVLPLASITKLMTALVAHELIEGSNTTSISLSAILQDGSSGLLVGEELTAENLRELALISSSNDAAYALAASVGALLGDDDPAKQFVAGMNIRASELNLNTLEFLNTTGLDISATQPGAVGSAKDVSFLMEYIVENYPDILTPTQQSSMRIYNSAGAYHDVNNTNQEVANIPNLLGSKTGYTDLAGGNLTIAFDAGFNRPIIITVLGSTREERFTDVITLMEAVQKTLSE